MIPDKRNDENLAVAQTHLAFQRFHNRVVDTALPPGTPANQRFIRAREIVVKHYQWVIRHDYLPRILEPSVVDDVFANGRKVFEKNAVADRRADDADRVLRRRVPARPQHDPARLRLEQGVPRRPGHARLPVLLLGHERHLGGGSRLPSNWIADWRRLYDLTETGRNDLKAPPGQFNRARRIDTLLADPLKFLPRGSFGGELADEGTIRANLAFRNLVRPRWSSSPRARRRSTFLKAKGVNVNLLSKAKLRDGDNGAEPLAA